MPTEADRLQGRGALLLLWVMLAIALALLLAAWTQPLFTVRIDAMLPDFIPEAMRRLVILDETRSVITMTERLYETGYSVIASLIVIFAVALPILKNVGVGLLLASQPGGGARSMARFLQFVGRFAMVDIFAVGIVVSVMATNTIGQGQASPVTVEPLTALRSGFYIFVGYVLFSIALDVMLAIRYRATR